jgi:hypothetical protein
MRRTIKIGVILVTLIFLGSISFFIFKAKYFEKTPSEFNESAMVELTWMDLQKLDLKTNKLPDDIVTKISSPVKLPGYIVPLEANLEYSTHFLFVPNQAYCVHVPPPPANLMVEVTSRNPVKNKEAQGPIWLEGNIALENSKNQFGTAAWQFKAVKHYPYELRK